MSASYFSVVPTAREKAEKKLYSFAFVKLVADDGTTLYDGPHDLYVYKVNQACFAFPIP